ncbi:hypothetical protein KTC70_23065 [Klebsiella pneumoniae]|nr:hypothetical protein [Klebsiella pneumoniae]
MKGSNIRRWGAALAVVIIAGAAYWFWHDRGTSGSGAASVRASCQKNCSVSASFSSRLRC